MFRNDTVTSIFHVLRKMQRFIIGLMVMDIAENDNVPRRDILIPLNLYSCNVKDQNTSFVGKAF